MSTGILRYLKPVKKQESTHDGLPNPQGLVSAKISPAAIASANELVCEAQQVTTKRRKNRGVYHKLRPSMRARIGMYSCGNGVAAAARHFSRKLDKSLNESTVRGLKKAYLAELGRKRRAQEEDLFADKLNSAKRGPPLLRGEQIDETIVVPLK